MLEIREKKIETIIIDKKVHVYKFLQLLTIQYNNTNNTK